MTVIASLQANLDFNLKGASQVIEDLKKIEDVGKKASEFKFDGAKAVSGYVEKINQLASNFDTMFSSAKLAGKGVEQQEAYLRAFASSIDAVAGKFLALDQAKLKAISSPQQAGKLFASLFDGMDINKLNSEIEKYKSAIAELAKLGAASKKYVVPPPPVVPAVNYNVAGASLQKSTDNAIRNMMAEVESQLAANIKISGNTVGAIRNLNTSLNTSIEQSLIATARTFSSASIKVDANVSKAVNLVMTEAIQHFVGSMRYNMVSSPPSTGATVGMMYGAIEQAFRQQIASAAAQSVAQDSKGAQISSNINSAVTNMLQGTATKYLNQIAAAIPPMDSSLATSLAGGIQKRIAEMIRGGAAASGAGGGGIGGGGGGGRGTASGGPPDDGSWKRMIEMLNGALAAQRRLAESLETTAAKMAAGAQSALNYANSNRIVGAAQTAAAAATNTLSSATSAATDKWNAFINVAMLAGGRMGQAILWSNQATLAFKDLGKSMGALSIAGISASAGVGFTFSNIIRVAKDLEPAQNMLTALGMDMSHLTEVSLKHGLEIGKIARSYISLKVAMDSAKPSFNGLEGTQTDTFTDFKRTFEDIAAIGAKFGMRTEEMRGSFKAIEQMFSKGTVQAEEFRQQLGDRIPGAMSAGILAFRQMTGNAEASMRSFMDAMKKGEIETSKFVPLWLKNYKEMVGITEEGTNNINTAQQRLSTSFDLMIRRLDNATGTSKFYSSALNGVASALGLLQFGPITGAVANLSSALLSIAATAGAVTVGFRLASAAGVTFGATMTSAAAFSATLLRFLGPVGIALGVVAAGMALFSGSAKAATADADALIQKTDAALAESKTKLTGATLYKINNALAEIPQTIMALEKSRDEVQDSLRKLQEEVTKGTIKIFSPDMGMEDEIKMTDDVKKNINERIAAYKKQEAEIGASIERLSERMKAGEAIQRSVAAPPTVELEAKRSAIDDTRIRVDKEIRILELYVKDLKQLGTEAANARKLLYETRQTLDPEAKDLTAPSKKAGVEDTVRRMAWRNALNEEIRGLEGLNAKREEVIKHAENLMEGMGLKEANLIKKNDKLLTDYVNALLAVGEGYDIVEQKAQRFRVALAMQEAGINMSTLQFKPFMAMQKGLESMADSIGDLVAKGQLGTQTLGDAFRNMAQSIIKDIISMIIKVNVIKPLLEGLFGAQTGGGGGIFGPLLTGVFGASTAAPVMQTNQSIPYIPNTTQFAASTQPPSDTNQYSPTINIYNPTPDSVELLKKQLPDMMTAHYRDSRSRGKL